MWEVVAGTNDGRREFFFWISSGLSASSADMEFVLFAHSTCNNVYTVQEPPKRREVEFQFAKGINNVQCFSRILVAISH